MSILSLIGACAWPYMKKCRIIDQPKNKFQSPALVNNMQGNTNVTQIQNLDKLGDGRG